MYVCTICMYKDRQYRQYAGDDSFLILSKIQ